MAVTVPPSPAAPLAISLFGPWEVCRLGEPLPRLHSRKGQWLLALLTLRHGREVERAWLAAILWPESGEGAALANLRNSLTDLRGALGPEADRLRSPTPHTLSLDLTGAAADVVAFDQAIAEGETAALERAVALYRGPLLEGCAEEWAFQERQVREQAYLGALETLAARALAAGEAGGAEGYLRRAVGVDPLRESAQRALMAALAAGGNEAAALLAYRALRVRLQREMSAEPDPETQALFRQIRAEARGKADGVRRGARRGDGANEEGTLSRSVSPSPRLPVASLPEGTVTFLFTDIEGSTRLWEEHPEAMRDALEQHDRLLRHAIAVHDGVVFKTMGDQCCAAFAMVPDAVAAALAAQRALQAEAWGRYFPPTEGGRVVGRPTPAARSVGARGCALWVRMALHTGAVEARDGDYAGPPLNRVARLLAAGHGGQVLLSQPTSDLARDHLPEGAQLRDLGERRLKDLVRPERVFQLVVPDLPADFPPLQSLEAVAHNLPVSLTRFIGREREIAEVKQLLAGHHLVTLTGVGGCGKSRLSLQVAADLLSEYTDGVWLVELAPLSDPALVPPTVAFALGVREVPGRPLTQMLVDTLRAKSLLLLLDNCEHLLVACAQLTQTLLHACPNLRILASSREALGLMGEHTYRVPSLTLPDPEHLPPVESLRQYEAIGLFVDRAGDTAPGFAICDHTAAAVAQVCHRLDGIPLAIELAAARVRALPVEQIAARLDDRFRLLTGGSRTALPRQQTLRALMDWSYDLLTEPERTLLRRLSVFAEGATLEAAEAVGAGDPVEEWEVLDLLTHLVDKSLVIYEEQKGAGWGPRAVPAGTGGAPWGPDAGRYRLLETVRQYARDRLIESGGAEAVRDRHLQFFVQLAERAQWKRIRDSAAKREERFAQITAEQSNLRAALEWSLGKVENAEAGLRLAGQMWRFWARRSQSQEGREWLEELLKRSGGAPPDARANALEGACNLALGLGDYRSARSYGEESLVLFRELGDREHTTYTLERLVYVAASEGDLVSALSFAEEGLAISRELGNQDAVVYSLGLLGTVARWEGDYPRAREFYEASLAMARELGDSQLAGWGLCDLGLVLLKQADYRAARSSIKASLKLRWESSEGRIGTGLIRCLEAMAQWAVAQREYERMARLFGAAEALREAIHAPPSPADRAEYDGIAEARLALGEEAFAAAWAEGRAMTLDQATTYALQTGEDDVGPAE